ncbi:hypothetical protein NC653_022474 [Populus alba x Populus x berolinensis]|uniref:Uncharacterized protein n=1 Tax=Populus alba x Populus x berolinensis TaxID=444605 RepID=A0AAD6QAW5_9ROSI|nr:hypothetical protein NC653_022474 [Populus alba x Populus x berolinensis]
MQGYIVEKTRIRSTSSASGHHSSPSGHQKPGQTQHKEKRGGSGLQPRQTLPNLFFFFLGATILYFLMLAMVCNHRHQRVPLASIL